ncbi:HipA domain-containing protein [uncultured Helicobacter sp.]|uniref:HipA domain-containing protein n=1 Tax=uncultured Helicobacter sp. TaxID=175537 RepID=UPI0037527B83
MEYVLKNKDKEVLRFSVEEVEAFVAGSDNNITRKKEVLRDIEIIHKDLLPINLDTFDIANSLQNWINKRKVPSNREFVEKIVATYEHQKLMGYVDISLALSLNDSYWIVPTDKAYQWKDYNLYHNEFSEALELVAFGMQDSYQAQRGETSPEYTTNGMLKKCWHRENGKIYLYKGSSRIYHKNAEAFSEYYMAQVAQTLGFECVSYDLVEFHNQIVSACPIFTSESEGYVPMYQCLQTKKSFSNDKQALIQEILKVYDRQAFQDMMVFDALIGNIDRHLGNFGMIIDNDANALLRPAPIFDNGLSLMARLSPHELRAIDISLANQTTYFELGFDEQLSFYVQKRHLQALENLSKFEFSKHPSYNVADSLLESISAHIRQRALKAIDMIHKRERSIVKTADT